VPHASHTFVRFVMARSAFVVGPAGLRRQRDSGVPEIHNHKALPRRRIGAAPAGGREPMPPRAVRARPHRL
jgi:hypothetical protein